MEQHPRRVSFTIPGEPQSKANSRRLVMFGKKPAFVKSKKALAYVETVKENVQPLNPMLEGDLSFTAKIYYATRRPDLDESLILDALQGLIYKNDRQVKQKHVYWGLDRENPRAVIHIGELE